MWAENDAAVQRPVLPAALQSLREKITSLVVSELCSSPEFAEVFDLFECFMAGLKGPSAQLWLSYTDMVGLLLSCIQSSRDGD